MSAVVGGALVVVPFALGAAAAPADDGATWSSASRTRRSSSPAGWSCSDGLFVTTNDSGDSGRVFTVDPATAATVGVTTLGRRARGRRGAGAGRTRRTSGSATSATTTTTRPSISVTRVPVGATDQEVAGGDLRAGLPRRRRRRRGAARATRGPDGCSWSPRASSAAPCTPRPTPLTRRPARTRLRELGGILPIATDGAFFPDGRHLVLRDYGRAAVYTSPASTRSATSTCREQQQGEGIAVDEDGAGLRQLRGGPRAGARGAAARRPARGRGAGARAERRRRPPSRRRRPARARARSCRRRSRRAAASRGSGCSARRCSSAAVAVVLRARPAALGTHPSGCSTALAPPASGWVRAAPPEDLARRAGLDPAAGRDGVRLPRPVRRAARRRRRAAGARPGDPAGVAGRVGHAVRERAPAGGRHRRGRPAAVPLPPGLARAGGTPRSSTGCCSSARRCRGRGSGC